MSERLTLVITTISDATIENTLHMGRSAVEETPHLDHPIEFQTFDLGCPFGGYMRNCFSIPGHFPPHFPLEIFVLPLPSKGLEPKNVLFL